MSVSTSRVAPKDPRARPGGTRSLWRLRGYLRPYRAHLAVMGSTALLGVFVSLSIPLVTKSIIDGPIAEHRSGEILPLGLLALALGITEAALILIRRWVQARAVLGFETAVRKDLYRRMQALPMEFHGRWQSGQLLSRVTTDLSALRRFMGFGLLLFGLAASVLVSGWTSDERDRRLDLVLSTPISRRAWLGGTSGCPMC